MIRQTSLQAYKSIIDELQQREMIVLKCIRDNKALCCFEISDKLNLPMHSISGRLTSLEKKGYIEALGYKANPNTGRLSTIWVVK